MIRARGRVMDRVEYRVSSSPLMRRLRPRFWVLALALALVAGLLVACGSEGVQPPKRVGNLAVHRGAEIFSQRCAGCHTLSFAGTEGSAQNIKSAQRNNGPNFDQRKEYQLSSVLYAIRNGGFSGAIMPQNIVLGPEAVAGAQFVVQCSGKSATAPPGSGQSPAPKPNPEVCG